MIDIATIRRGLQEKRRAARRNIIRPGPHPRWPSRLSPSPVDTTCRICARRILKGTRAYIAPGEMHCIHHIDMDFDWPYRLIASAVWPGNCVRCNLLILPGDTFVWRSRSWCAHHGPKAGVEHIFHCHKADME